MMMMMMKQMFMIRWHVWQRGILWLASRYRLGTAISFLSAFRQTGQHRGIMFAAVGFCCILFCVRKNSQMYFVCLLCCYVNVMHRSGVHLSVCSIFFTLSQRDLPGGSMRCSQSTFLSEYRYYEDGLTCSFCCELPYFFSKHWHFRLDHMKGIQCKNLCLFSVFFLSFFLSFFSLSLFFLISFFLIYCRQRSSLLLDNSAETT